MRFGGDGFRKVIGGVLLGEQGLPLEVGLFHKVAVDDDQFTDAGAG